MDTEEAGLAAEPPVRWADIGWTRILMQSEVFMLVLDFDGGICVSQLWASSAGEAVREWLVSDSPQAVKALTAGASAPLERR